MTLEQFRTAKDELFRGPDSPLGPRRKTFTGLKYFPIRSEYIFTLPMTPATDPSPIQVEASSGPQRTYHRAGNVHLKIDGQEVTFHILRDANGNLFLPFRDGTSGHESYGAGRYLEPHELGDGSIRLDFNYAYNPYCAYTPEYSCPFPPRENWSMVPIRAGEMTYHPNA